MNFTNQFLLALALLCSTAATAQTTRKEIASNPESSGGIYHSYPAQPGEAIASPTGYTPFYISHYGRHGSRWHSARQTYDYPAEVLRKAAKAGTLTLKGRETLAKIEILAADAVGHYGDLSPRGVAEHRGIAERMFGAYPELFSTAKGRACRIESRSTLVPRCILSMAAFNERLKELNPQLSMTRESSERYLHFIGNRKGMLSQNKAAAAVGDSLRTARTEYARIVASLFTDASAVKEPVKLVRYLYMLASITQDVDYLNLSLYDLFTDEELYDLWQIENVRCYLTMGPSARFGDVITSDAKPLLQHIEQTAQAVIEGRSDLSASLRFGHDVNLIPLAALLGIVGADGRVADLDSVAGMWSVQKVSPMGANIQFVFFRNKAGDVRVRVLHNERDAKLPLTGGPFYPWEVLRDYLRQRIG